MADIISVVNSILEFTTGIKDAKLTKRIAELTLVVAQSEKAQLIKENAELKEQNIA
jgi:hypothetical protein